MYFISEQDRIRPYLGFCPMCHYLPTNVQNMGFCHFRLMTCWKSNRSLIISRLSDGHRFADHLLYEPSRDRPSVFGTSAHLRAPLQVQRMGFQMPPRVICALVCRVVGKDDHQVDPSSAERADTAVVFSASPRARLCIVPQPLHCGF